MSEREEIEQAEVEVETEVADKEQQKAAKGVDSVTDYVEEKAHAGDAAKAQSAISALSSSSATVAADSSLVIKDEDWKLLVDECDLTREQAEALLRKNNCDIQKAMIAFIHS